MYRVAEHFERTDTGRQRQDNEDSLFARPPLFAVADGMGGAQAGEVASRTAVQALDGGLPSGPGSVEERLAGLVARANQHVHALAQSDDEHAGMGTTMTAAYLGEDDLAVAHVGDSRLYCLRDGRLEQRTDDHSLVGELVRRGQISAQEAEEHPQRSIITRALGIEHDIVVDHHTWPVRDGDIFMLCSDGLTSMVGDTQVAQTIGSSSSLAEAGRRLIQAANDAGGRDNITVILFRVEEVTPGPDSSLATGRSAVPEQPGTGDGQPTMQTAVVELPLEVRDEYRRPREPRALRPSGAPAKRRRSWPTPVKAGVTLFILLAIIASAAWIASRGVYFVGTDNDGFVTLYQGLPYDGPVGIRLYQKQFTSGVPAVSLGASVRKTVTEHKLRSHDDAIDLLRQLERGELAGQR